MTPRAFTGVAEDTLTASISGVTEDGTMIISFWANIPATSWDAGQGLYGCGVPIFAYLQFDQFIDIEWFPVDFSSILAINTAIVTASEQHHFLFNVQTNHAIGAKVKQCYIDDVLAIQSTVDNDDAFTFTVNGETFVLGADNASPFLPLLIGTVGDFYWAPGQSMDMSVAANRRKFILSLIHI